MRALLFILSSLFTFPLLAQADAQSRSWNQPVEPFHIAGNLYYVGASDITSFLFTTPAGHIVLDAGFVETAPMILQNIYKLGFDPRDVKILLNTQAHYDHAAGFALLKKLTGAKLVASREDAALMARGGADDFGFGDRYTYPPVKADRFVEHRGVVTLGGFTLRAHITPGHTRGCTTWTAQIRDGSASREAIFVCSASVPGYQLVGNDKYPEIISDYERTFRYLSAMKPQMFFAAHGQMFDMQKKIERMRAGERNAFVDPAGYAQYVVNAEASFRKIVADQRTKSEAKGQ